MGTCKKCKESNVDVLVDLCHDCFKQEGEEYFNSGLTEPKWIVMCISRVNSGHTMSESFDTEEEAEKHCEGYRDNYNFDGPLEIWEVTSIKRFT